MAQQGRVAVRATAVTDMAFESPAESPQQAYGQTARRMAETIAILTARAAPVIADPAPTPQAANTRDVPRGVGRDGGPARMLPDADADEDFGADAAIAALAADVRARAFPREEFGFAKVPGAMS